MRIQCICLYKRITYCEAVLYVSNVDDGCRGLAPSNPTLLMKSCLYFGANMSRDCIHLVIG